MQMRRQPLPADGPSATDRSVSARPRSAGGRSSEALSARARLASGLVLVAFVASHLLNHALGLVSLQAMEDGRRLFLALWRSPPGTLALYAAFSVHIALAFVALYRRRSLRMPLREALQLVLGLLIPLMLAQHVLGTRGHHELAGFDDGYAAIVRTLWVVRPDLGAWQSTVLLVAWAHGCLGLFFWLRHRPWFGRAAPLLFAVALLLPVLSLLGFADAGQALALLPAPPPPDAARAAELLAAGEFEGRLQRGFQLGFLGVLVGVLGLRGVRALARRGAVVEVAYPGGRRVRAPRGVSILEASRLGGIPHHSACGGRGRCSTCRVRVLAGADALSPPGATEEATLARIGAAADVRLACQARLAGSASVVPLLSPAPAVAEAAPAGRAQLGQERTVAVLFCDLRNFTGLAEQRLPFDVVFLLNRYFAAVGGAVDRSGGLVDKFIGDGAMALFGLDGDPAVACRRALAAAREIAAEMGQLVDELSSELSAPLRIAIGIHVGPAIVGSMGYGTTVSLTAVGDTVNVASRLETLAKQLDVELVVSEPVIALAGADLGAAEQREIAVRGRAEPLKVFIVPALGRLPAPGEAVSPSPRRPTP